MFEKKDRQRIEQKAQKKREVKQKFQHSIQKHNGHRVFEMSPQGEVREAELMFALNKTITWQQAINRDYLQKSNKILHKKDHLYCTALNIKNAIKHFKKMKAQGVDIQGKKVNPNPIKLYTI